MKITRRELLALAAATPAIASIAPISPPVAKLTESRVTHQQWNLDYKWMWMRPVDHILGAAWRLGSFDASSHAAFLKPGNVYFRSDALGPSLYIFQGLALARVGFSGQSNDHLDLTYEFTTVQGVWSSRSIRLTIGQAEPNLLRLAISRPTPFGRMSSLFPPAGW